MYLFRSLNHIHCVVLKGFRPQAQACLDRAQLPSQYPSGHFVTKEQILCLVEAQQGAGFLAMHTQKRIRPRAYAIRKA